MEDELIQNLNAAMPRPNYIIPPFIYVIDSLNLVQWIGLSTHFSYFQIGFTFPTSPAILQVSIFLCEFPLRYFPTSLENMSDNVMISSKNRINLRHTSIAPVQSTIVNLAD